jgi:hypothetical protein
MDQRQLCCKTAGACSTKGHKMKVSLSTKTICVFKHTCNGHAWLKPNLGVSLLLDGITVGDLLELIFALLRQKVSIRNQYPGQQPKSLHEFGKSAGGWEAVRALLF